MHYDTTNLRETAFSMGATYFGIADLSQAHEAILAQGGEQVASYPYAISVGIALQHSLVDGIANHHNRIAITNYRYMAYDAVNLRLDQITLALAGMLQSTGYRNFPVPVAQTVDPVHHQAVFSNKMAASLAGLGWIGKSCLLVTPQNGPRVRFATVLTNAPLEPTGHLMETRCGDCRDCADICPAGAIKGVNFRPEDPRSVRLDAAACSRYFDEREKELGLRVCGLCLYVCPHGKMASSRLQ